MLGEVAEDFRGVAEDVGLFGVWQDVGVAPSTLTVGRRVGSAMPSAPRACPPFSGDFGENGFGRLLARVAPGVPALLRPEALLDHVRCRDAGRIISGVGTLECRAPSSRRLRS